MYFATKESSERWETYFWLGYITITSQGKEFCRFFCLNNNSIGTDKSSKKLWNHFMNIPVLPTEFGSIETYFRACIIIRNGLEEMANGVNNVIS